MNKLFIALVCFSVFTLSFAAVNVIDCAADVDEGDVECVADCGTVPINTDLDDVTPSANWAACNLGCLAKEDCETYLDCSAGCLSTYAEALTNAAAKDYYTCLADCANSSILAFSMIVLIFAALLF